MFLRTNGGKEYSKESHKKTEAVECRCKKLHFNRASKKIFCQKWKNNTTAFLVLKKKKTAKYDSGLLLYDELSYIAASADSEVKCKCCGASLVQIQGSLIRGEVLSVDNLGY